MRIQDHLGKITWTVADKAMFFLYGLINFVQIYALREVPDQLGLYGLLANLQTWIFILSDGLALQNLIQFGMDRSIRPRVNMLSLTIHVFLVMGVSLLMALFSSPLAALFHEPQLGAVYLLLPLYCLLTLPRAFCLKLLLRDAQMKQVFWVNFAWFATMTAMTAWMLTHHSLRSFESMAWIACTGMGVSSVVALVLCRGLLSFSWQGNISLRRLFGFSIYQTLTGAINNSVRQLDAFVFQSFFGLAAVGVYQVAKTLYRIFETVNDAVFSLVYPATVRLLSENKSKELLGLLSKALSFFFLCSALIIILLEAGMTHLFVSFLGARFIAAEGQFNLLCLAALFLPFIGVLMSLLMAKSDTRQLLVFSLIATSVAAVVFYYTGFYNLPAYFPLGIVAYSAVFAMLEFWYANRSIGLSFASLARAIPDTLNFIRARFSRS